MKVLVTGGTGFAGSHLTRRLLERGHHVVALDNQPGRFFEELKAKGAELHLGSVTDRPLLDRLAQGCEVVYHLAAAFRQINAPKHVYWDVNVEGTRRLLQASLEAGVKKFIYCSTQGVHGHIAKMPGDEASPIAPEDYYQYTKYEGERLIPEFVRKGLQVLIVRPTAIYGPGDPERFYMLFRMANKGKFLMFGDGRTHYHPVYIENLVDGFELAATSQRGDGSAYLIADERHYSLNELVTAIGESLGKQVRITHLPFRPLWLAAAACEAVCAPFRISPPIFRRRVDWFRQNRAFTVAKAEKELGYKPRVGLRDGLARTAAWYREQGML
jgi:nucleoside-diphosphate-sugar epimerase